MTHNTQWNIPAGSFDLGPLPDVLAQHHGVIPLGATIDPSVGEEVLLVFFDPELDAPQLAQHGPISLSLAAGLVEVDAGPVAWTVFLLSGAEGPWAASELSIDPRDQELLAPFAALGQQTHWHVVVVGRGLQVLDVVEIANDYNLDDILSQIVQAAAEIPLSNFALAKAQFEAAYTLQDLMGSAGG